jgi:hypothetical protein
MNAAELVVLAKQALADDAMGAILHPDEIKDRESILARALLKLIYVIHDVDQSTQAAMEYAEVTAEIRDLILENLSLAGSYEP